MNDEFELYDVSFTGDEEDELHREPEPIHGISLEGLTDEQLYALAADVDGALPAIALRDISIEQELVKQYKTAHYLQSRVLADPGVPANQRAQTLNAVASCLASVAKLQMDMYTSERLKTIENILLKALRTLPREQQDAFLREYEALLRKEGRA